MFVENYIEHPYYWKLNGNFIFLVFQRIKLEHNYHIYMCVCVYLFSWMKQLEQCDSSPLVWFDRDSSGNEQTKYISKQTKNKANK